MKRMKGFTLIELLIVVAIIAILAAIAVPNFLEAQVRSKVSRVRTDHRSMATAIESYYVDNNSYPASTNDVTHSVYNGLPNADAPVANGGLQNVRTFKRRDTDNPQMMCMSLTTPIAYVTSYFPDPFADTRGATFPYWSGRTGWILGSWGPDTDQRQGGQLLWNSTGFASAPRGVGQENDPALGTWAPGVETVYNPLVAQPSMLLLAGASADPGGAYTYDPTNGTVSKGDLWRVKQ